MRTGRGDSGHPRQRRREVDVDGEVTVSPREVRQRVVADDQRDANALLVGGQLLKAAMLPPPVAVVGGEHDDRVVEPAGLAERRDDSGDRVVDGEQGLELSLAEEIPLCHDLGCQPRELSYPVRLVRDVGLVVARGTPRPDAGECAFVPRCGCRHPADRMRGEGGEVQEERSLGRADERGGFVAEHVRRVVRRQSPVVDLGAVHVERVVQVAGASGESDPAVPAGRHVRSRVADQVLADQRRVVAGRVQPGGDRRGVVENMEAAVGAAVRVDPCAVGVAAREDARPTRAADRVRDEGVREGDALRRKLALDGRHDAERVPALVVGDDEDDAGRLVGLRGSPLRVREETREQRENDQDSSDSDGHASPHRSQ